MEETIDIKPVCDDVDASYRPDFYAVYVIKHPRLGYFAGYKPHYFRMPMFCSSLKGATKFDTFEGLAAKERAIGVRDGTVRDGAKVLAFRRQDIFPEKYINPNKNQKKEC